MVESLSGVDPTQVMLENTNSPAPTQDFKDVKTD